MAATSSSDSAAPAPPPGARPGSDASHHASPQPSSGVGKLSGAARRRRTSASASILLQVNVAREAQKSGASIEELPALIAHVRAQPMLSLRGLMTIPPAGTPDEARPHFRALRALAAEHALPELSMGMSADLEVAVEEGATLVRVGTAIFGARG